MNKVRILVAMEGENQAREFMLNVAAALSEKGLRIKEIDTDLMVLRTEYTVTAFIYDKSKQGLCGVDADALFGQEPYKSQLACYLKDGQPYTQPVGLVEYIRKANVDKHIDHLNERFAKLCQDHIVDNINPAFANSYTVEVKNGKSITVFTSIHNIKNVIFNDPATIVFWADGTKTVVRAQDGEKYDPEKGLAMAISKKSLGNQREYYHIFKHWLKKYKKPDKVWEATLTGTLDSGNFESLLRGTLGPDDITITFEAKDIHVE